MMNQTAHGFAAKPNDIDNFRDNAFRPWTECVPKIHQVLNDANIHPDSWAQAAEAHRTAYERDQAEALNKVKEQPRKCLDFDKALTDTARNYRATDKNSADSVSETIGRSFGDRADHNPLPPLPPDIQDLMKKAEAARMPVTPPINAGIEWVNNVGNSLHNVLSQIGVGDEFQKLFDLIVSNHRDPSEFIRAANCHEQVVALCDQQETTLQSGMKEAYSWEGDARTTAMKAVESHHQNPMAETRAHSAKQAPLLRQYAQAQESSNNAGEMGLFIVQVVVVVWLGLYATNLFLRAVVRGGGVGIGLAISGLIVALIAYLCGAWFDWWPVL